MGTRTRTEKVGTVQYAANNNAPPFEVQVPGRYLHNIFLELDGVITETAGGGTALARNPGTLLDIRLRLNQRNTIKDGRWQSFAVDRAYLYDVIPVETPAAAAIAAYAIHSVAELPMFHKWGAKPFDSVIDMTRHRSVHLDVTWRNEAALIVGGTNAFTTAPTVDVIVEVSDDVPPDVGAGSAYFVQREIDSAALGAVAAADTQIELPVAPGLDYTSFVLVALDTPGAAGRTLVATALNELHLESKGVQGTVFPFGPLSGAELQFWFEKRTRHPDGVVAGLYPIPFLSGPAGGLRSHAVRTGDMTDLRFHVDHAAFATAGTIKVLYDALTPVVG